MKSNCYKYKKLEKKNVTQETHLIKSVLKKKSVKFVRIRLRLRKVIRNKDGLCIPGSQPTSTIVCSTVPMSPAIRKQLRDIVDQHSTQDSSAPTMQSHPA